VTWKVISLGTFCKIALRICSRFRRPLAVRRCELKVALIGRNRGMARSTIKLGVTFEGGVSGLRGQRGIIFGTVVTVQRW
jgi:hypothetical protein